MNKLNSYSFALGFLACSLFDVFWVLLPCFYKFIYKFIHKYSFKKFIFKQIAIFTAPSPNKWLEIHCPYSSCDNCKIWNCSKY